MATNAPTRYGWTTTVNAHEPHAEGDSQLASVTCQPLCSRENAPRLVHSAMNQFSGLALPKDKTITISVIAGPSKGVKHEFTSPLVSIGRRGAGADIQIDDAKVSGVHCVIGVKQEMIRLCDLDSTDGTYINDERVQAAGLEHLSEFRIGSSWFLLTILTRADLAAS
jgi:type III secretion system (T3SS) inner membrane Yop/YscD-like protein